MGDSHKDYIGMWFRARLRHGIGDDMRFGVINPDTGDIQWYVLPHRRFDGIGAVAHLLRERGQDPELPGLNEAQAPDFWRLLPAMLSRPPVQGCVPDWHPGNGAAGKTPLMAVDWASRTETDMIRRNARELGISVTVLLFWALHQVVSERLLRSGYRGSWFFPVNMRGPVRLADDEMNHSSGFYLDVDADWTPMELRDRIRDNLAERRHWVAWRQARIGRWVGQWGVNRIYDRLASVEHVGSFSTLGEWHQDMAAAGWPASALMCCLGPGSPGHPVSNGAMIWNGRLTLALQFQPALGFDQALLEQCLHDWRGLLLDPGAMEVAA